MFLPIIFLKVKPIKHHQFKRKVFAECRSTSVFVIILLNFSSLLFITTKSWSYEQACNKSDIKTEQLTTIEELVTRADAGQEKDFGSITEKIANNLSSSNLTVSCMAVNALTGIGLGDQFVVNELLKISNDPAKPLDLRHNAIMAIKSIKIDLAKIQIISLLDDKNPTIRSDAAEVLQNAKWEQDKDKQNLIEKLTKLAKDDQYEVVRKNAISALGNLQKESKGSIIIPISALKDHSWRVRSVAVESIGEQEKNIKINEELVLNLLAALKNQNATLRTHAALAIEKLDFTDKDKETKEIFGQLRNALKSDINIKARSAAAKALKNDPRHDTIKDLIDIFSNTKEPKEIRKSAFNSIISTAEKLSLNDKLSSEELEKILKHFNEALKRPDIFEGDQRAILENRRDQFNTKKTQRLFYNNVIHNPWAWAVASCFTLYLGIFYMHPLWLIKIDDFLRPMSVKVSYSGIEGTISLRFLNFLRFSSMVLDAWVVSHVQSVQEEFQKIESVEARAVYIPSPMVLNGRTLPHITSQDIRDIFSKPLLIWGEGGVGKTSLSCKIAQWAMAENKSERLYQHQMLPIFIEEDLDCEPDLCKNSLIDAILGQLKILSNEDEPISQEFLNRLLRRRRILVIIDHLSEMNEHTRKTIDPEKPDFPINALIVTSRQEERLGISNKIKPLRIIGNRLSSFLEAYLMQEGKRDLFTDSEFFDACSHLSRMVGQRDVTPMLATLYAKQLISTKLEVSQEVSGLPENVPELMISYLNELNRDLCDSKLKEDNFDDRTVHQDAKAIAWACVQEMHYPTTIKREAALLALAGREGKEEEHLQYLEERLHLVQTVGVTKDSLKFSLDPLAEYLASMHLIDICQGDEKKWLEFLEQAQAKLDTSSTISGFLTALQECCFVASKAAKIPPQILSKLSLMGNTLSNQSSPGDFLVIAEKPIN